MILTEKTKSLIRVIEQRSQTGSLPWTLGAGPDSFTSALSSGSIVIAKLTRRAALNDILGTRTVFYRLTIQDDAGDDLDVVDSDEVDGSWPTLIATIHEYARRSALAVDERLDKLLEELGPSADSI